MPNLDFARATAIDLLQTYDVFLLDAYGILVNTAGAIPHAARFLAEIEARGKTYLVVTNDAVRLPETASRFYAERGLDIAPERILTAGLCLPDVFADLQLQGRRCAVVGSNDTFEYVRRAAGVAIPPEPDFDADAVVVGSDAGLSTIQVFNDLLSSIHRLLAQGRKLQLILANTDVIYPRGNDRFGVTSGGVAWLLEHSLGLLHPTLRPTFVRVGKPSRIIFSKALQMTKDLGRVVMLGDQLATDIVGARAIGIDSALVLTGLTRSVDVQVDDPEVCPTWVVSDLSCLP